MMKELELIGWLEEFLGVGGDLSVPVGVGDDMAVIRVGGNEILIGSDMLVEGVHFNMSNGISGRQIGHKAIGVCFSDCAAMGGKPMFAVVSLAFCKDMAEDFIKDIFRGIKFLADEYGCRIVGGDLSASDRLVIDVALIGICEDNKRPVLRSGARTGDTICVTGKLGGSLLGKQFSFVPRINEASWLTSNLSVSAMIDISDGLSRDLWNICVKSGCVVEIYEDALEEIISQEAKRLSAEIGRSAIWHVLNDGEDFELLLCVAGNKDELPSLPDFLDLYAIGRVIASGEPEMILVRNDGGREKISVGGYQHFE